MPYIIQELRDKYLNILEDIQNKGIENVGTLNYLVTMICGIYLTEQGERYKTYNDIVGTLECAKLELYRRLIAPYEDKAIERNGDL